MLVPLSIRVPQYVDQKLANLAKETGRSKNFYVREALEDSIEDLEDFFLGMKALEEGGETYSRDDVKKMIENG